MYIETDRLCIRTFEQSDVEALERIQNDPQVLRYIPDFIERDASKERLSAAIREFRALEELGNLSTWRCYAVEHRKTGQVVGCLSFGKSEMLHEYELGWQIQSCYTGHGYASEAAQAFAEYFCMEHGIDYLIAVMDTDNPASYRTAEKSGFRLFERRTVYDVHCGRFFDDYYYFRRYYSGSMLRQQFYGDVPYTGRGAQQEDT